MLPCPYVPGRTFARNRTSTGTNPATDCLHLIHHGVPAAPVELPRTTDASGHHVFRGTRRGLLVRESRHDHLGSWEVQETLDGRFDAGGFDGITRARREQACEGLVYGDGPRRHPVVNLADLDPTTVALLANLRQNEERFRAICEHAPVMIDQFGPDGRCMLWNRECEKRLGYTQEEVEQASDPLALFYPDDEERARVLDAIHRADGTFREYRVRAKDGTDRIQMWADFRLPSGAQISVGHDVTAQRRVEEQLRQSQKMEALGQLTGGMAHDFNNLLTVVLAHAEMLKALPPGVRDDSSLDEIIAAATRGATLVQKLMAIGRDDSVSVEATDLHAVVQELAPTMKRLLPDSIRVRIAIEPPLPRAFADRGAVEQALINLVTNARDAMPDGGQLTIELGTRWLGAADAELHGCEPGEHVTLVVSDDGAGMRQAVRERVFEPFFTTKGQEGTGLGLPMVYGLMRQQRGTVLVTSELDRGTQVHLLFRRAKPAGTSAPHTDGVARVLVVEDEPSIRTLAASMLERAGYAVQQAPDGRHALDQLRRTTFDLVLCDVVMPHLGGVELLEAAHAEGVAPPFLFVTGNADDRVQRLRTHPRFAGIVRKPYHLAQLLDAVAGATLRREPADEA